MPVENDRQEKIFFETIFFVCRSAGFSGASDRSEASRSYGLSEVSRGFEEGLQRKSDHGETLKGKRCLLQVVDQPIHHWESKTTDGDVQMLTSQGPGTTFAFALKIVEILLGSSDVKKIREAMLL